MERKQAKNGVTYTVEQSQRSQDQILVLVWPSARANKPRMQHLRPADLPGLLAAYEEQAAAKAEALKAKAGERARKARAAAESVQVGDVFVCSWGYDQTNVDFYEVIAKSGATVTIRKIGKNIVHGERGSDRVAPCKGDYRSEPMKKRISEYGYITISSYASASKQDRESYYQTASGWGH